VLKVVKRVKALLEKPYTGSYKVLERISNGVYKINIDGEPTCISVKYLKPAVSLSLEVVAAFLAPADKRWILQLRVMRAYERKRKAVNFAREAFVEFQIFYYT